MGMIRAFWNEVVKVADSNWKPVALRGTQNSLHVDASPDGHLVTQHDSTNDPNGPFCGLRFDVAGTVHLISGGVEHVLTVIAGEYFPGVVTRVNSTDTTLTDAQMIGFKRQ